MARYRMSAKVRQALQRYGQRHGLAAQEINVLDWGCGRGESVAWLREQGYNAYGVDVNEQFLENGRRLLAGRKLAAEQILTEIDSEGRTTHQSGFFHFVFSEQVFEHVAQLDHSAREISRVTAEGGRGLHSFPAHRMPYEPHLYIPLVHWLPKNHRLRTQWLKLFLALGLGPHWPELAGKSLLDQAATYSRYTIENTFYRPPRAVRQIFTAQGLKVHFATLDTPAFQRRCAFRWASRLPGIRSLLNAALVNVVNVDMRTIKPASSPGLSGRPSASRRLHGHLRERAA